LPLGRVHIWAHGFATKRSAEIEGTHRKERFLIFGMKSPTADADEIERVNE